MTTFKTPSVDMRITGDITFKLKLQTNVPVIPEVDLVVAAGVPSFEENSIEPYLLPCRDSDHWPTVMSGSASKGSQLLHFLMPDTESNMSNDEVCSSPSHSSTDDSDSDNSATRVESPSSQPDWLEPVIAAAADRIMLQVDAAVTAASTRIMLRVGTVIDAAFADFKSVISKKLDDLLAVICDKLQQQNQSFKAKFQEQERTLDALKAETLELKKEMRLLLESREGPIDRNVTRSTKRLRSQTNPEPSTTHPRD